jgi:hypothetical protein
MTIVAIGALRMIGFACNVVAGQNVAALYVLWGSMLLALGLGVFAIARGAVIEPPAFLTQLAIVFERLFERMSRRLQPT